MPDPDERESLALRLRAALGSARPIGAAIGLVLLAIAIVVVLREREVMVDAWAALRSASTPTVAVLLGSMAASVFLTGTVFWLLTRRFGPVGFVEMQALMASTALANYLPLRPGLVGRIVFHRARHDIRARDSLRTIVEAMGLTVVALAMLVPSMLAAHSLGQPPWVATLAPAAIGAASALPSRTRGMALAFLLRYGETLLTAVRYHLAFTLVGAPLPWHVSAAVACVSMIATMVPFVSNGIGLREWAVGLLAPLLAGVALERGLAAELVHRAAEVLVIVPCGLLGALWLWRSDQTRRADASRSTPVG